MSKRSGFDALSIPESNATSLPAPYRDNNMTRWFRRLGDHAGLRNFGVNLTRIIPGGQSSYRHWHAKQDEFVYVLEGEVLLVTDAGEELLRPGMCAGFPAGSPNGHQFVNRSSQDVLLLVVGDRTANEVVTYPDIDLHGTTSVDGHYTFTRKDSTPL